MNRVIFVAVAASVFLCGPVMAQSAKFSASWDTNARAVKAEAVSETDGFTCTDDGQTDPNDTCVTAEVEMATLHVGSKKSILIGVSSEIGIYLVTNAKGGRKDNGDTTESYLSSTATASGDVSVSLTLENEDGEFCDIAPNPGVTLKSEMRELKVSGGGSNTLDLLAENEEFWIEVALKTNSMGAHHFEFLGVECEQGMYTLTANFDLTAFADASGYDANSEAMVTLYDRMITMQEVRAVKGSLVSDSEICDSVTEMWDMYLGQCVPNS